MKLIDKQLLDDISRQAKQSDRLRVERGDGFLFHQESELKIINL